MTVWIIEPRDPLIFRDGRPFDAVPGVRAVSLSFPFPSTVAGAVRAREGQDTQGRFQKDSIARVKGIPVRGPFLIELNNQANDEGRWLVHAPSDALLFDLKSSKSKRAVAKNLVPLEVQNNTSTNLPQGLLLVGMPQPDFSKPSKNAPRYWYWEAFQRWLLEPKDQVFDLQDLGHNGPVQESRFHVGINPETRTADVERGALFQTRGLEFTRFRDESDFGTASRLALAIETDAPNLKNGPGFLGGERRLVVWRRSNMSLPACPTQLKRRISKSRHCRIVLLTPAHFELGWKPTWILSEIHGVTAKLKAIAVGRPHIASGWDLHMKRPKPARRLALAGTVLFLELNGNDDAIERWVDRIWMSPISDAEHDRLDGSGVAVIGVWDGKARRMEV
jgi:CRISPR-associated protein Cmr3